MDSNFTGGPGFLAFVATFALVGATILLMRSLSKHLRKMRVQQAREEAEARADDAVAAPPEAGPSGDGEGSEGSGDEVAGEAGDR